MTYLAVPYSHHDAKVREARYIAANRAASILMKRGDVVFSPISHSHPIEAESGVVNDGEFWAKQDDPFLQIASLLVVLKIDGWRESKGVQREIVMATSAEIPIEYMEAEAVAEPLAPRKTAYEIAREITSGERQKNYGPAWDNHQRIASIWSGILHRDITPREVILCMIGVKLARDGHRHKQDNLTDIIGYAKIADEDKRFSTMSASSSSNTTVDKSKSAQVGSTGFWSEEQENRQSARLRTRWKSLTSRAAHHD